ERSADANVASEVAAPMPGVVIAAHARADQVVHRGDLLFVVEAMKMELRVEAPADGTVRRVLASVGEQVSRGQPLAEFEPAT
ncbi:MAG TPA: biotin/lipoyl-containing protein, partial [Candidatus Limnocylindrales bacterium]|nr:biotin/lipoyl-containing protein [Candidatus Limnocylindrales bacterium]